MMLWSSLLLFAQRGTMSGLEQVLLFFPLILAASLVYGVTRHEHWPVIFREALRMAVWFGFFTISMFLVVLLISQFN